jgi:quinol monooxygenase YgiN
MARLELSAHMTVRPGCLEGFKKHAAELIRITQEKDTHTLRYDWFLSLDGTECEVREAYTGPEGLIEHNRHILDARTRLFNDYADNHFMTVRRGVGAAQSAQDTRRRPNGSPSSGLEPSAFPSQIWWRPRVKTAR